MKNDILIACYSWHGNTRKIAELIASATGGDLFEIDPVEKYSSDYNTVVAQAKKEIRDGFRPELKALPENTSHSVVFLGSPIWWYTMAPPVAAFLDSIDIRRKTVVPFHTHGGGGGGTFEADIADLCPGATVREGFGTYNAGGHETAKQIESWLQSLGLLF